MRQEMATLSLDELLRWLEAHPELVCRIVDGQFKVIPGPSLTPEVKAALETHRLTLPAIVRKRWPHHCIRCKNLLRDDWVRLWVDTETVPCLVYFHPDCFAQHPAPANRVDLTGDPEHPTFHDPDGLCVRCHERPLWDPEKAPFVCKPCKAAADHRRLLRHRQRQAQEGD